MNQLARSYWLLALFTLVLGVLVALTIKPYDWNVSAFIHMDQQTASTLSVPHDFVVLTVPGYDGEQYYEIARHMPDLLSGNVHALQAVPTIAYSYQRFLLPLAAHILSFNHDALLPYVFLSINLLSLIGVFALVLSFKPKQPLYAFALAMSPAALIGLHFSLAEPLTLILLTAFLLRFLKSQTLGALDIILLSLLVLTREVNVLFIVILFLYLLFYTRRWKDCALLLIPLACFAGLHLMIFEVFHAIPFLWSTGKHSLPFEAIGKILIGMKGYTVYTLSSIALFFGFVLPALIWTIVTIWKERKVDLLTLGSLVFLVIMTMMADDIWGSITSIGRVITPVYPLVLLSLLRRDTLVTRLMAGAVLALGLGIGFALALMPHPFILS